MEQETTRQKAWRIGNECGINAEFFADFIVGRFPWEQDGCYIGTWAERFATGTPQVYMDSQSLDVYNKLLSKYR